MSPVVDVHCHTFNADDVPVRGFAHGLFLHDVPFGDRLARLVDLLVQGAARSHADDVVRLQALLRPDTGNEAQELAAEGARVAFEREVDIAMAEVEQR
ncbi:MAG TPA: hypothetical protein VF364_05925, partial [Candidatus Limnocylindria bacterium]